MSTNIEKMTSKIKWNLRLQRIKAKKEKSIHNLLHLKINELKLFVKKEKFGEKDKQKKNQKFVLKNIYFVKKMSIL